LGYPKRKIESGLTEGMRQSKEFLAEREQTLADIENLISLIPEDQKSNFIKNWQDHKPTKDNVRYDYQLHDDITQLRERARELEWLAEFRASIIEGLSVNQVSVTEHPITHREDQTADELNQLNAKISELETEKSELLKEVADLRREIIGLKKQKSNPSRRLHMPPPRGYEKRHPDDTKLWAIVDDPEANDNERTNAFSMILGKEGKRRRN